MIKRISIKNFDGDITKRWYVEYYELDSEKNVWIRKREYGSVNKEKELVKRKEHIQTLCGEIMNSWSPGSQM